MFSPIQTALLIKNEFLFNEDNQYTGVWTYCGVYTTLRSLSNIDLHSDTFENNCVQYLHH